MLQKRFLFQLGICCNLLVLSVWFTTRYWRFHMSDTRPLATASYSGERFRIQFRKLICISNNALSAFLPGRGSFTNYVDKILAFFDHLPPCVDIFYGMNVVDKKWTFFYHLPTSSCKRSLWTTPYLVPRYVPVCFCSVSALHKYAFLNYFLWWHYVSFAFSKKQLNE